jgi:hypothetical protein
MICMFRQYTCQIFDRPGRDLIAAKSMGPEGEPQVSPLRYAPVEMTILFGAINLSSRPERTRISYYAALTTSTYAPFRRERRIEDGQRQQIRQEIWGRSGEICGFHDAQSASAAIEDANLDTCSKDSGSMPRVSTASNAWPTSSRVGAKEVGRRDRPLSCEAV